MRLGQSNPAGIGDGLRQWGLRLLVGHLEEQQVRQLLDVVAVGEAVVAEDVAVVPELLDDLLRLVAHGLRPVGGGGDGGKEDPGSM